MKRRLSYLALAAFVFAGTLAQDASAQSQAVLSQLYGRGVHAYYAGQYTDAYNYLSSAIGAGTKDPRAYYFRGIVLSNQGRMGEAEADWNAGAQLEVQYGGSGIGAALSRFQGMSRLKLENIRQTARFQAMATRATRSNQRMNEIGATPAAPSVTQPRATKPRAAAAAPPPAPTADAATNPFADDTAPAMAGGAATVDSVDAMADVNEDPFADDPAPAAAGGTGAAPSNDPFGAPKPAAPAGNDPFGTPPAGGDDPFGAPPAGADDPFGASPF
ncbi:MAG: hypothetical protein AAFX06_08800 [Planctomycetota bacterium]